VTLTLPDSTRRARIVRQLVGPIEDVQLRHVPSDWVIVSVRCGPRLEATVERLRRAAARRGYVVEDGVMTEDWNPKVRRMMRS
jgi:hypothetical protein